MRICPTCDRPRQAHQVMCRICWFLVPHAIRAAVWKAYRGKNKIASRVALRQAITAVRRLTV